MGVGANRVLGLSMQPTAAVPIYTAVTLAGDQSVTPAGADALAFGVCQEEVSTADVADGRVASISVMGTSVMVGDGVIVVGADVFTNAAGKASATGTTNPMGIALTASAADGDWLTVLLIPKVA